MTEVKLGADGQPIVDQGQKDEKDVLIEKLQGDIKVKEETLKGVVEEIKTLRQKKESEVVIPEDEVDKKVKTILSQEKQKGALDNLEKAKLRFFEENKDFHPDSDPAGLKFKAIQDEFDTYKNDGLSTVEEFLARFNKAKTIVIPNKDNGTPVKADGSSPKQGGTPKSETISKLSPKEERLIKDNGWTEERFLKLKTNQPDFVRNLLVQMPD